MGLYDREKEQVVRAAQDLAEKLQQGETSP